MTMEKNEFFIYQFPDHIQQRINAGMGCSSSIGRGWLQIILDMDKKLNEISSDYRIDQIKEKFGLLRYYISGIDYDKADEIIREAAAKSGKICEMCGKPAKLRNNEGWYQTLCDKHSNE